MGPRLFRRGNEVFYDLKVNTMAVLQWGHVFSDVEMRTGGGFLSGLLLLQWGHVFSDVEIFLLFFAAYLPDQLQWGHVFSDVEIAQGSS